MTTYQPMSTNLPLPTNINIPISTHLPTYVYLPCQPTIIYLPLPIPKYQNIIPAGPGAGIGLVCLET